MCIRDRSSAMYKWFHNLSIERNKRLRNEWLAFIATFENTITNNKCMVCCGALASWRVWALAPGASSPFIAALGTRWHSQVRRGSQANWGLAPRVRAKVIYSCMVYAIGFLGRELIFSDRMCRKLKKASFSMTFCWLDSKTLMKHLVQFPTEKKCKQ